MKSQLSINLRYCCLSRGATQNVSASRSLPTIGFKTYVPWLTAISSRCLAALPAEMSAFNSYMRQNGHYRNLKCTFENMLPCYCDATKANSGTIRSRVSQPAFAAKGANWVNCISWRHYTRTVYWLMCSVSVTTKYDLSLQELTQIIETNCLFYFVNKCLLLSPTFQGGQMPVLAPLRTPMRGTHAVPIRLQKANGSPASCSSKQRHPRQRVCDCLSNSYKPELSKFFGRGPHKLLHNSSRAWHLT